MAVSAVVARVATPEGPSVLKPVPGAAPSVVAAIVGKKVEVMVVVDVCIVPPALSWYADGNMIPLLGIGEYNPLVHNPTPGVAVEVQATDGGATAGGIAMSPP